VREVAAARCDGERRNETRRALALALAAVYPGNGYNNPALWPRCAPLAPHLVAICDAEVSDFEAGALCSLLLTNAATYFHGRAAYSDARRLFERPLAICEKVFGPEHPITAKSLSNLATLLKDQGDFALARSLHERALAIREKVPGPPTIPIRRRTSITSPSC